MAGNQNSKGKKIKITSITSNINAFPHKLHQSLLKFGIKRKQLSERVHKYLSIILFTLKVVLLELSQLQPIKSL